jgi:hypothetical protein
MTNREALLKAMAPKSDQLNADDLVSSPKNITITGVKVAISGEQRIHVHYQDDEGKPWKPSKGMARIVAQLFGDEPDRWIGQSLTLYRNPDVKYAGEAVGGIWISHATGLEKPQKMMITVAKSKRVPHTVHPFVVHAATASPADEKMILKQICQSIRNAAKNGTESLAAYWNTVTTNYRNPDVVSFYNGELLKAQEVDRQKEEQAHINSGVVPVSDNQPSYANYGDPGSSYDDRGSSGIEDM